MDDWNTNEDQKQTKFCIIMNHLTKNDNWLASMISIISQSVGPQIFYLANPNSKLILNKFIA